MTDKPRIIEVTAAESEALCAAGKYRPGVPMFWVRGERTYAVADQMREWRASQMGKEAKHE